jgi:hypothetical protein
MTRWNWPAVRGVLRRVLVYELAMWRSLYLWVLRRPAVRGERFPYAGIVTPVIWAFIVVSAIEVPIVHFLVPWDGVRGALLFAGVYGVLWMVGMLAALRVHPHTVDDGGLHVRHGGTVHLLVPWAEIESVRRRRRPYEGSRSIRPLGEGDDRVLAVVVGSQTTVDVELRRPLPLLAWRGDTEPVTQLRIFADDDGGLAARLRDGLERPRAADAGERPR